VDAEAVQEVLEEMGRLMPGKDAKMVLLQDPGWLLRVERGTKRLGPHPDDICMPSASTTASLAFPGNPLDSRRMRSVIASNASFFRLYSLML